jgi:putative transposase
MKDRLVLFWHLLVVLAKLLKPGGVRAVAAETLLMKQQLIVMTRSQRRAPKLLVSDRFLLGFLTLFLNPWRIVKNAVIVKPSTLLAFHKALVNRKYQRLFSSKVLKKPGPKGPSCELINAIVEMKQRNPRFGCPRIAQQISMVFGVEIDKDVVRRVLQRHYHPGKGGCGPSWLSFLGHAKDSLWSIDLFRCESIGLVSH